MEYKFTLSTDSTCDLYQSFVREHDIQFAPLTFTIEKNGNITEHLDCFTDYAQYTAFYDELRKGGYARTSKLNYEAHMEHFTKMAQAGVKDVLHFTISSGLASTVELARDAGAKVKEQYPDFNLYAVDSLTATIGQGMLVKMAMEWRDAGKTAAETYEYITGIRTRIQHFIMVDSLSYLQRGGRVSKTTAVVGGMLNFKPVLYFDNDGKLVNAAKFRGMKKAMSGCMEAAKLVPPDMELKKAVVVHTGAEEKAKELAKLFADTFGFEPEICIMGPVIGSHVGPDAVAFGFISTETRDKCVIK